MRRARVDALGAQGDELTLSSAASHHLLRVLRQKPGAVIELFDGAGGRAQAILQRDNDGVAIVSQLEAPRGELARPPLHLLIGVPKRPAFDLIVRMATELGVTHLHPVRLKRCVPTEVRVDRMERIAQAAAHQCHRDALPALNPMRPLAEVLTALPADLTRRVALPAAPSIPAATGGAALLVGPEGGLHDAEVKAALDAGFEPMGLGPLVLRADTACAAAIARVSDW